MLDDDHLGQSRRLRAESAAAREEFRRAVAYASNARAALPGAGSQCVTYSPSGVPPSLANGGDGVAPIGARHCQLNNEVPA